jgi:hypothetical protein
MSVVMKITQDAFESMVNDSGMLLKTFNPNNPVTPQDSEILTTTTGGITLNVDREITDLSDDVNNAHGTFKQYQVGKQHKPTIQFTAIEMTPEIIAMGLGSADITDNKVTPRAKIYNSDFQDVWWVCKTLGDKLLVLHAMNTLSTGGFQFTTNKDAKGTLGLTLSAFADIAQQDVEPLEFYLIDADVPSISLASTTLTLHSNDSPYTLRAEVVPSDAEITWIVGSTDVCTVTGTWNGCKITPVAAGRTAVTGKITVSGTEYTATCLVTVEESTGA